MLLLAVLTTLRGPAGTARAAAAAAWHDTHPHHTAQLHLTESHYQQLPVKLTISQI